MCVGSTTYSGDYRRMGKSAEFTRSVLYQGQGFPATKGTVGCKPDCCVLINKEILTPMHPIWKYLIAELCIATACISPTDKVQFRHSSMIFWANLLAQICVKPSLINVDTWGFPPSTTTLCLVAQLLELNLFNIFRWMLFPL